MRLPVVLKIPDDIAIEINKIVAEYPVIDFSEGDAVNCMRELVDFILANYELTKKEPKP